MPAREVITLDPAEVASGRSELVLEGAFSIRPEGPNWGDAAIEQYLAEADMGQIAVDFRVPNRQVTIPLTLLTTGDTTFDEARTTLQQKVGLLQRHGGWLRRELRDGRVVYLDVVGATLGMSGGALQAQYDIDPDVDLVLESIPDFYGAELYLGDAGPSASELIFNVSDIPGDYPARSRIVVTSSATQRGVIAALRSEHRSAAATARLEYEAEDMTPLDAAVAKGAAGEVSDGNLVEHASIASGWTPILSTDLLDSGALTHTGTYQVWARVRAEGSFLSYIGSVPPYLRLVWDVGDIIAPKENDPVRIPEAGAFFALNLGEIRIQPSPAGAHRWRGYIQAKKGIAGYDAAAADVVQIDKVWLVPVDDGYSVLRAPTVHTEGTSPFVIRDSVGAFDNSGAINGTALDLGGNWTTGGPDPDFEYSPSGATNVIQRDTTSDLNARVAEASDTTLNNPGRVRIDFKISRRVTQGASTSLYLFNIGDESQTVHVRIDLGDNAINASGRVSLHAMGDEIAATGFELGAETWYTVSVAADEAGRVFAWIGAEGALPAEPTLEGWHPDVASVTGWHVGIVDSNQSGEPCIRQYDNLLAWSYDADAVIHSDSDLELRWDRAIRETADGAAFGPVAHVIGGLLRLPPAGMEGRQCEVFIKGSRGDLDAIPDSHLDDLTAGVYARPSWLFVPDFSTGAEPAPTVLGGTLATVTESSVVQPIPAPDPAFGTLDTVTDGAAARPITPDQDELAALNTASELAAARPITPDQDELATIGTVSNPTVAQPVAGSKNPPPAAAGIYVLARIDGGYQHSAWGASTSQDAPWAAGDAAPNAWDTFEAHVGKALTGVQWGGNLNNWPPSAYDTVAANRARSRGAFSQYDWGTTLAGCQDLLANNATARSYLGALATQMKDHGHPVLFRPLWEMNGTWFAWGRQNFTAAQYVTMWRNLWQIFADVMGGFAAGSGLGTHTGNVSFLWCPNDSRVGGQPDPSTRYPGDAYVDWLGFDGYMFGNEAYKSPATIFNSVYNQCAALSASKPIAIGEFGACVPLSGGTKDQWLADFFDNWLPAHPRVKAINYFNEGSLTPGAQYYDVYIETPESSRAIWANRIAAAKFKANIVTSGTFPSGQKIPIP